jgi:uncharacterized membrane protein
MRCFTAVVLAVVLVSFPAFHGRATAAPATGNIKLCNNYPHAVLFAFAWSAKHIAYSRGWWTVTSNHCLNVPLPVTTFYWYASTAKYDDGNGKYVYSTWAGTRPFCESPNGFYFNHADGPCGKNGRAKFQQSFTRTDGTPVYETVQIGQSGSSSQVIGEGHTQALTEPP